MTAGSNPLAAMLRPAAVEVDVPAASRKRAIEAVAALVERVHGLPAREVSGALFDREHLGSTSLGSRVAIPHARLPGLRTPQAAVLRLAVPVDWDGPDEDKVQLLLVMLVPQAATDAHLQALAAIAEMLSDRAQREALLKAPDASALHTALMAWRPAGTP
jgi:nitrogen PTS system EIIA component